MNPDHVLTPRLQVCHGKLGGNPIGQPRQVKLHGLPANHNEVLLILLTLCFDTLPDFNLRAAILIAERSSTLLLYVT